MDTQQQPHQHQHQHQHATQRRTHTRPLVIICATRQRLPKDTGVMLYLTYAHVGEGEATHWADIDQQEQEGTATGFQHYGLKLHSATTHDGVYFRLPPLPAVLNCTLQPVSQSGVERYHIISADPPS